MLPFLVLFTAAEKFAEIKAHALHRAKLFMLAFSARYECDYYPEYKHHYYYCNSISSKKVFHPISPLSSPPSCSIAEYEQYYHDGYERYPPGHRQSKENLFLAKQSD